MNPLLGLAAGLLLVLGVDAPWKRIEAPFEPRFPRDHGAHEDCRTEWWYATGIVADTTSGETFGWQLTIFRRGVHFGPPEPADTLLTPRTVFAAHLALTDLARGDFVHAERRRRAFPGLAWARGERLDAGVEGWTLRQDDAGVLHARAVDPSTRLALELELVPTKPPVLHGLAGVSTKGSEPGNASAYVSWTRLETRGTLVRDGVSHAVRGTSWFDHEWGSSQLGTGVVGWDWFGLRLEDGRDLMLYRLRRADGTIVPESSGTLVAEDGTTRHLACSEITLEPLGQHLSTLTGASYPARWRLRVPSAGLDVEIDPRVRDCEFDARGSTGNVYWEGPVRVHGSVAGEGFGEFTGYAGAVGAGL